MNAPADLPSPLAGGSTFATIEPMLWHHIALCQLGLPLRASNKGTWRREVGSAAIAIEAGEGSAVPTGRFARLLLMHFCDVAYRSGATVVDLGASVGGLAETLGIEVKGAKLRELDEQLARLLAARITVAWEGSPPLAVFDARARLRGGPSSWRNSIRLNARFVASLEQAGVALERRVALALLESPLAMDLYAFARAAQPDPALDGAVVVGWEDLRERFGSPSQATADLRAALEQALDLVRAAAPGLQVTAGDTGLVVPAGPAGAPAAGSLPVAGAPVAGAPAGGAPAGGAPAAVPPAPVAAPRVADPSPPPVFATAASPPPAPGLAADAAAGMPEGPSPDAAPPAEPVPSEATREATLEATPEATPEATAEEIPGDDQPRRALRQTVSLRSHLTGLPQVVWLQRANGRDTIVIEVTPGGRYDPETRTVIALEPVTLQIAGGLYTRDFDRVAAWAAVNRDLIDDWWESRIDGFDEVSSRVKRVPAPGWR